MSIAVLFACDLSPYKLIAGLEVWDKKRNATRFAGNSPVIAHPPCRTWGALKTVATKAWEGEHEYALFAMEQVRKNGGVLEHPAGSSLFAETKCGTPEIKDNWGGGLYYSQSMELGAHRVKANDTLHCRPRPIRIAVNTGKNRRTGKVYYARAWRQDRTSAVQIQGNTMGARSNATGLCEMACRNCRSMQSD